MMSACGGLIGFLDKEVEQSRAADRCSSICCPTLVMGIGGNATIARSALQHCDVSDARGYTVLAKTTDGGGSGGALEKR